ncbi:MAG: hypothetical protein ACR2GY_13550 [Phycisphaerales bacterium]
MPRKKRKKTGRGRPSALSAISMTDLQAEIDRRTSTLETRRNELQSELDDINALLGGAASGRRKKPGRPKGTAKKTSKKKTRKKTARKKTAKKKTGRGRGRPKGSKNKTTTASKKKTSKKKSNRKKTTRKRVSRSGPSLSDYLAQVMKNKTLSIGEAADAVLAAGYPSKSPNLRTMVNQQLIKSDRFKKVSRGHYTTK